MNTSVPLLPIDRSCEDSVRWLQPRLARRGLRVLRTFDLRDARMGTGDCRCPHHGTRSCDCQMMMLLVYGGGPRPATLMLHSNEGCTWLSIVDTPAQPADPSIRALIEDAVGVDRHQEGL